MIASHEATRKQHAHNATPLIFPVMSFHSGRKQCARAGMFVDKTSHTQTEKRGTFVAIALCAPQSPKDVTVLQYVNDVRPDGYDLLFETSDGTLRQETGVLKNPGTDNEIWEVVGKYKWVSPDGEEHIMDFVANEGGVGGPGLGIRGALVGK
uniref:Uncharacterized protein n=1 Tax=Timema shepardi TaxID=629360 RepID=A0A7R9FXJ3_TIMSH|nr:unnamed protein product [Timema shepardi]